jgi:hypothetical protein
LSAEFPANWRYVPLKLIREADGKTKYICAIPYEKNRVLKSLGTFKGVDIKGVAHFGDDNEIPDIPYLRDGVAGLVEQPGYAVGIFPEFSRPNLVIVDCDSVAEWAGEGNTRHRVIRNGKDQLFKLTEKHGELPLCPTVRGNRPGHCYLIFRQNRNYRVMGRKIKPLGLAFDVLPRGYQVHWTAGARALIAGEELLINPPELPTWLAQLVLRHKQNPRLDVPVGHHVDVDGSDSWNSMFREAVLREVDGHDGGWNQRLFNAACTFFENGVTWDRAVDLIIERCEPRTPNDERDALTSIASAWRKVTGEAVQE